MRASLRRLPRAGRPAVPLVAPLLLALLALAPAADAATFGAGPVEFTEFKVPGTSASEPTIGIPWNTDTVFYFPSDGLVQRARFGADGQPTWDDATSPLVLPVNLDPMLVADPDTGRVFAGGLLGPCSSMAYSDDDGDTWLPTLNMCSGTNFDHQSIGLGPPAGPLPSPEGAHVGYYCAQGGTGISCARSVDQGTTWLPFQTVGGSCAGFHGHIRVSVVTGTVVVPTASCGSHSGYIMTKDGGLTWTSHEVKESAAWTNGFDPGVQWTRESGWLYYGMASEHGVYMALSKDEGATWEKLGGGMGVEPTTWLDVGQFHDPPVVSGVFTNVQAGDDDRVAVSFLGLEAGPGADLEFLRSNGIYNCDERQAELVWHQYVALSYDAGQSWSVHRLTADPAQVGGVYDVVVDGSGACRNLLDFQDMDIDSQGRIHIGWADGCTGECATTGKPETSGWRTDAPRLLRQTGGRGLFSAADVAPAGPDAGGDGTPEGEARTEETPGLPLGLVVLALAGAFVATRHRAA